jgi:hypothetical protein
MGEKNTHEMPDNLSFEDRVFAGLAALNAGVQDVYARLESFNGRLLKLETYAQDFDARLQKLEARAYDTKPIWEKALKEIVDTRRELSKRLDRIEPVTLGHRANVSDLEVRVEKLEFPKLAQ